MPPHKHPAIALEIDRLATQLAKDPHSKAFLPLAEEYCKVGMWEEAVGVLQDGLKYYPGFITAMVVLGRAYDQLNQPTKARAVLEAAIKLSPDNLRAHRTLIKIYTAEGLREEALSSCRVILAMNPRDKEALSVQASLALQEPPPQATDNTSPSLPPGRQEPEGASAPPSEPVESKSSAGSLKTADTLEASIEPGNGRITHDQETKPTAPTENARRHANTIARLEAWLQSLHQRRRDLPTIDSADPEP